MVKTHDERLWGIRWAEFTKDSRRVTKQRDFLNSASRERFANDIQAKDNFAEFVAWSDPVPDRDDNEANG